ncbi:MAG: glycosyltransferase family 2 protein [Lachnospiraceae bacterium]|nr:glycosyltransferase family 2 protein [Lachnospiraceae bacterium]
METGSKMIRELISIIVPVYNGEAYLGRCVQSIQAQNHTMWELLLIDGGSADRTLAFCEAWRERDDRIRVFHSEENRGVSYGRNTGIREARGEYLFFVDADDWLQPDCLSRLYEEIRGKGVQIAGCGFERCSDGDWEEARKPSKKAYGRKRIAGKDFLAEGILKQDTRCWGKLYRRELLEGRFFKEDYTIGEDMLFLWETAREAETVSSSEYPGYCYYYNMNGAMLRPFRASDIDQIRCWQYVLDTVRAENDAASAKDGKVPYGPEVMQKTASILLISCMLTMGKLACLPVGKRKKYAGIRKKCSQVVKETLKIEGAYVELDGGYRLKVGLFERFPALYIGLYGLMKRASGLRRLVGKS